MRLSRNQTNPAGARARQDGGIYRRMASLNPAHSPIIVGLIIGLAATSGGIMLAFGGPLLAAAFIAGLLAVYVVLRDIEIGFWGVVAVVCLIPFATLPVDVGITPTFLDLALGAVVGIWVLQLVTGQKTSVENSPITIPIVIFLFLAVFAFIFGLQNGPFTPTLARRFAELCLSIGFVIIVVDYCRDWRHLARLTRVVLVAGGGAALVAILLWLIPDDLANTLLNYLQILGYPGGWVIRYIEENPELSERAIGTSVDPNALGGLLLMIGAMAAPQLVAKRPLLPRWLTAVVTGLIFVALLLTFSRGAMAGLVAGLGFVAMLRYRRLIPYMLLAGLLVLVLPLTQEYVARFVEGVRFQDLATQMRVGEFRDAVALISRYPLIGVGFAGSPDIDLYLGVANVYLTITQQMGLLGMTAFFGIIGTVFGYAFVHRHAIPRGSRIESVWLGYHAAIVGGLVSGIFDHYLFNIDFHHAVTAFWLLVGLAVASTRVGARADGAAASETGSTGLPSDIG